MYGNVVNAGDQSLGEILSVEVRAKPGESRSRRKRRRKWRRKRRRRGREAGDEGKEEEETEEDGLIIESFVATSVEKNRR